MKAVYINHHGGPEVLTYGDLPDPEPGFGEVTIKLNVAALNRLDCWVRAGWKGIKLDYPHILGADGAGIIVKIGEGVHDWKIGNRVVINSNLSCGTCEACSSGWDNRCRKWGLLGETRSGTYAELITLSVNYLLHIPDRFPEEFAAAGALVYHTAWHSLIVRAGIRPGETVLVVGASGGVNLASIQIAKLVGARVIVVGSNSKKLALAEANGADYTIDRSKDEYWSREVHALTNKKGVDVVVDNVGITFPMSFRAAGKGARILTVGNTGGAQFEIDNRFIFSKHLSILGSTMGTRKDFSDVMGLIFNGNLKPVIDREFKLSEARAAHKYYEAGKQMGKIILRIAG